MTTQVEVSDALIIQPDHDANAHDRMLFACGSTEIRPNDVFYPTDSKQNLDIETHEPWGIVSKVRGLAVERITEGTYPNVGNTLRVIIHGVRSLSNPRESGHQMEGRVSIDGKRRRAFTSSMLFRLPDGKLCDVEILYVCNGREAKQEANEMYEMTIDRREGAQ